MGGKVDKTHRSGKMYDLIFAHEFQPQMRYLMCDRCWRSVRRRRASKEKSDSEGIEKGNVANTLVATVIFQFKESRSKVSQGVE